MWTGSQVFAISFDDTSRISFLKWRISSRQIAFNSLGKSEFQTWTESVLKINPLGSEGSLQLSGFRCMTFSSLQPACSNSLWYCSNVGRFTQIADRSSRISWVTALDILSPPTSSWPSIENNSEGGERVFSQWEFHDQKWPSWIQRILFIFWDNNQSSFDLTLSLKEACSRSTHSAKSWEKFEGDSKIEEEEEAGNMCR